MNRGEVWWYELPDVGRRPGCVLTRQAAQQRFSLAPTSR